MLWVVSLISQATQVCVVIYSHIRYTLSFCKARFYSSLVVWFSDFYSFVSFNCVEKYGVTLNALLVEYLILHLFDRNPSHRLFSYYFLDFCAAYVKAWSNRYYI